MTTPPQIDVEVQTAGDRVIVTVSGEIDMATAESVRRAVADLRDAGRTCIVLDLGAVSFMDCQGLNMLLALDEESSRGGWRFVVRDRSLPVARLLALSGMTERFTGSHAPARGRVGVTAR